MNKKICLIILLTATLFYGMSIRVSHAEDYGVANNVMFKDSINYDSLLTVWYSNNISKSFQEFNNEFIDIDLNEEYDNSQSLPDSVYIQRLNMLATAVQLPYNDVVKRYIHTYTFRNPKFMGRLMGLAEYYMPIFEQEFDLQGVPDELKIMAIIESALNPTAMSGAGAGGLWQFMLRVGKSYGLEIDSFVDERFDPVKSTKVAARFIKDLYKIYGDWTLVIAAYNCGPGNVNKAMRRAPNAKTYWDIYYFLPRETRNHIPAFIAATYAYTFHKAHGIEPIAPPFQTATDTVMVNKMMHFEQISSTIHVPIEIIRSLNPQYKLDIIPANKEKQYSLTLPLNDIMEFVSNEDSIYAKDTTYLAKYKNYTSLSQMAAAAGAAKYKNSAKVTYKVRSGDNLGSIARRYGTTAQKIMTLNGIRDPRSLQIGKVIKVK